MLPVSGEKLIALIPQKQPFVFISTLLEASSSHSVTSFRFDDNHILCENGKLTVAGLLENIAQTAAAKTGYECFTQKKKVPVGFIGDVRDFVYTMLPKVGEELITDMIITHEIFDVTLVTGRIKLNGQEIASCKMKIFEVPETNPVEQKA